MITTRILAALPLLALLAACAEPYQVSRAAGTPAQIAAPDGFAAPAPVAAPRYAVRAVSVTVPRQLKVSEANQYFPIADIVWRDDPRGDRHAQVQTIFETAVAEGTGAMHEGVPVVIEIEVTRFHALTEKARFTVGGSYAMRFMLTLRHAETGALLDGPRPVLADARAAGGARALEEEALGLTQKRVVTARLAEVIAAELTRPAGQDAPKTGLLAGLFASAN